MKRDSSQEQKQPPVSLENKTFSPTNGSQMSNFFSTKGPIKAQNIFANQPGHHSGVQQQQSNQKQTYHTQIPTTQNMMMQDEEDDEDEYYGEEGDDDDDMGQKRDTVRIFTPEQEAMILRDLHMSDQKNIEFLKVLNILQNDAELRPLIFEHEALLSTLKTIGELKAEQMLSILTAAETEMYENTKTKENQQMQQKQIVPTESIGVNVNLTDDSEKTELIEIVKKTTNEIEKLKNVLAEMEQQNILLTQELKIEQIQKDTLEKEKECTFKNLSEENKLLKKQNDAFKQSEQEFKKLKQAKEDDQVAEIEKLKSKLKKQETEFQNNNQELKIQLDKQINKKSQFINELQQDIELLEQDNENLHRKMQQIINQVLFWNVENKLEKNEKLDHSSTNSNLDYFKDISQKNSFVQESTYFNKNPNQHNNMSKLNKSYSCTNIALNATQAKKQGQFPIGRSGQTDAQNSFIQISGSKLSYLNEQGLLSKQFNKPIQQQQKNSIIESQHSELQTQTNNLNQQVQAYRDQINILNNEISVLKSVNIGLNITVQQLQQAPTQNKGFNQSLLMSPDRDQASFLTHQQNTTPYKQGQKLLNDNFPLSNLQSPIQPSYQGNEMGSERIFEQYEKLQNEFRLKIGEIGNRLINLFKKLNPQIQELMQFTTQEFSITSLKDIIYEIGLKVDQIYDFQNRSRHMNQTSAFIPQQAYSGYNTNLNNSNIMMDAVTPSPLEMKSLILEEKERRLQIVEELNKSREQHLKYQQDIDKLKLELFQEKQHNQSMAMSQMDYHSHSNEQLNKHNQHLQQRVDILQDENVTLKLKISELESDLLDERQQKAMKYDLTIDNFKSNMQGQYFDYKIRFDEQIMVEKENNYKLKIDIQGLVERNQMLNDQLVQYRDRIQELEKESVMQSKENYILQNELDYENIRSNQLQNKQTKIRDEILGSVKQDLSKIDNIVNNSEIKLKEQALKYQEQLVQKQKEIDRIKLSCQILEEELQKSRYETQKLKEEISKCQIQIQRLQSQPPIIEKTSAVQQTLNKFQMHRLGAIFIKSGTVHKEKLDLLGGFLRFRFQLESGKQQVQQMRLDTKSSSALDNDQRVSQLEEQIFKFQQQNTSLGMLIGKIIRQVNQRQLIKLNLAGLISKLSLDFILSGLKNNSQVYELNISNCGLDDEDLQKINEKLRLEKSITSLKIGQNMFNNMTPLLELLQVKGKQYTMVDLSDNYFDSQTLGGLCNVVASFEKIMDFNMAQILNKNNNNNTKAMKILFDLLSTKRSLKSLDLSKNKFQSDQLEQTIKALQRSVGLEKLSLNRVGLSDALVEPLIQTLASLKYLKRLDISGNNISSDKLTMVISSLKSNEVLEDLDISKSNLKNELNCCKELGTLIQSNNSLRQLVMIKAQLNDSSAYHLIQPIAESPNIEVIKLDFNQIGPIFIERLVKMLLQNKFTQSISQNKNQGSQSSFNDESDSSMVLEMKQNRKQGLLNISLECNNIGDRGAKAIADLIRTPNDSTKNLKMVNLNECGITNQGFEELRNALMQRASLASISGLSHVKITIERNNIE